MAQPDHAAVVSHSYRHRHGEAAGDLALEPIERALLEQPRIGVPTIMLDRAEDGVHPLPPGDPRACRFGGPSERRIVQAGHFLPRERREMFAQAMRDLA